MFHVIVIAALLLVGCSRPVDDTPIPSLQLDLGQDTATGDPDIDAPDAGGNSGGDGGERDVGQPPVDVGADAGGTPLGELWNTYYYLAPESEHPGAKTVELLNDACDPVATVSADYHQAVCIEGSGRLEDGRVINYSSRCDCGTPCSGGAIICWKALDPSTHPWGEGAFGNALMPLRSLAVDRDVIALRTVIYIEQFDGFEVPAIGGVEAFTHDGCFRADDVGGGIDGSHIDIFAGSTPMWRHLEGVFPTRSTLDGFTDVAKCSYLEL